jgi:Cof subfamily protein (haloacid dehalogenase superfamily)
VRCSGEKTKEELYSRLTEILGVAVTSSWQDSFDISAQQVSKGTAVERYAMEKGIDPSEIICFGDNFNDMEMIRFAGLGIATGNCVEPLKDIADYVTASNNEDGVAKAIEKFVL